MGLIFVDWYNIDDFMMRRWKSYKNQPQSRRLFTFMWNEFVDLYFISEYSILSTSKAEKSLISSRRSSPCITWRLQIRLTSTRSRINSYQNVGWGIWTKLIRIRHPQGTHIRSPFFLLASDPGPVSGRDSQIWKLRSYWPRWESPRIYSAEFSNRNIIVFAFDYYSARFQIFRKWNVTLDRDYQFQSKLLYSVATPLTLRLTEVWII